MQPRHPHPRDHDRRSGWRLRVFVALFVLVGGALLIAFGRGW